MFTCFLGIGSNLGDKKKNIKIAIDRLRKIKGIKIEKISNFYSTRPEGFLKQDDFLNGVIRLQTNRSPQQLLRRLKNIEKDLGRKKTIRFGPRIVDLDILLYGEQRIKNKNLIIPHPRMYSRDFVLTPLHDVAPELFKTKIIKTIKSMRTFVYGIRKKGQTIGFVPTMGYLHAGHLSLVRAAKYDCSKVVVSIFVNPAQFGPKEDFSGYPRNLNRDRKILKTLGVDAIFYPDIAEMYPKGYLTYVKAEKITSGLCGTFRPGHFQGVATIVTKLFHIVAPDIAYFGQKDAQQVRVIEKMVEDLNIPVKIKAMPIVREPDGLAMSSRNVYLNTQERKQAPALYHSLKAAVSLIKKGECQSGKIAKIIRQIISQAKLARIDYIEIVDAKTLKKVEKISGRVLIALAVWFGKTRLIDNILVRSRGVSAAGGSASGGK